MKKIMIGGFLFVSGILLYTGIRIAVVLHMKEVTGWSIPPGRYGTALEQIGAKKDIVAALGLCTLGIVLMLWDGGKKWLETITAKQMNKPREPEDEKIIV
jgi:hypothetical protein